METPAAPGLYIPTAHAPAGSRAMDLLLEECLGDESCGNAYPEIRSELKVFLERLGEKPAETGAMILDEWFDVVIRRDQFAEHLRSKMGSSAGNREIPWIISRAYHGDFTPFLESVLPGEIGMFEDPFLAEGLYLSVTCAEDLPFVDAEHEAQRSRDTWFGNYRVKNRSGHVAYGPAPAFPVIFTARSTPIYRC